MGPIIIDPNQGHPGDAFYDNDLALVVRGY